MLRKIHRWVSFPLILFLFIVTTTGLILQSQELGELGEGEHAPPTASAIPADAELIALVQKAATAARTAKADFPAQMLLLDFSRGEQKARFGVSPRGGPSVEVDLKSGETKVQEIPQPNLHVTMIQLHTGKYFGPAGLIIMGFVSLIFLVLTITGFIVYLNMWKRRKASGKRGLFWN
jgi:uncharacterized iron-regulated membrane protein